jgi:glycosyltransferase involved in cell wall biosynthesis
LLATLREDITFVVIGDGPQAGELMRHRDSLTKPDRVRFVGQRDDVAELLPHADIFWNGSEYEGQSNSILEAMQAGVCVVASGIAGNLDLIEDGVTGKLVKLGDTADFARQTMLILDNDAKATAYGAAAKDRIATEFTVEKMVAAHLDLYLA